MQVLSGKTVAEAVILGACLGDRSLRAMDQSMRESGMRRSLGSKREQVLSETTISRVSEAMTLGSVELLLESAAGKLSQQGFCKMEMQGRRMLYAPQRLSLSGCPMEGKNQMLL